MVHDQNAIRISPTTACHQTTQGSALANGNLPSAEAGLQIFSCGCTKSSELKWITGQQDGFPDGERFSWRPPRSYEHALCDLGIQRGRLLAQRSCSPLQVRR